MFEIGSLVDGKYKILNKVGQGGMSVVYMAVDEKANKTWAIKEVRKDGVLDFEAVKQGLVAEIDILKKLSHPNMPRIVDVIDTEDSFIIAMDYIQGNSLNKILLEYGAQPQEFVIEWAKQLCDVLGYLHSRKPPIIYRDMKPANIMLKPDGKVALIDFGTAREFKRMNLADTTCLGTVGYAAPEQFGGMGQTDARTDIYCLGVTLYELVTGCNPSKNPYDMQPIRKINPSLSSGLERIILKCAQRNPDDRYQSAAELMYALEHYEQYEDKYRRKQKLKLALFLTTVFVTAAFYISGIVLKNMALQKAENEYESLILEAMNSTDYEYKIRLYEECINISEHSGTRDAYLGLIQTYKDNDFVFTSEEAKQFQSIIEKNKDELIKQENNYADICFETGKLCMYYYGDENDYQIKRAINSIVWFENVIAYSSEDYENLSLAHLYLDIGLFYRDISIYSKDGIDKGKYKLWFDNMKILFEQEAENYNEDEIVRLGALELARNTIEQYADKLYLDNVTYEEVTTMISDIKFLTNSIKTTENNDQLKKNTIIMNLDETEETVDMAYRTDRRMANSDR